MASRKKLTEVVRNILIEMYANAEPPADFNKLVNEAETNEYGQKVIDYNAYEISRERADEIFDEHTKKLRKAERDAVSMAVWLGVSPAFKKEED